MRETKKVTGTPYGFGLGVRIEFGFINQDRKYKERNQSKLGCQKQDRQGEWILFGTYGI